MVRAIIDFSEPFVYTNAPSSSEEDMIVTAALPAAGGASLTQLYRLTTDNKLYYSDGSTWRTQGIGMPCIAPVDSDFAWFNQGTTTISSVNGGLLLTAPSQSGISNRMRVMAVPTAPYRIIVAMHANLLPISGTYNPVAGVFLSDGVNVSTSKIVRFGNYEASASGFMRNIVSKLDNATTFNSHYQDQVYSATLQQPFWLMIQDDTTNRLCRLSGDGGTNWTTVHSIGRTDFFTPTHCGFCLESGNTVREVSATVISWYAGT